MRSCTRAASHGVQSDEPEGRVWCTICAGERACGILVASRVPTSLVGACVMCVRINCDCAFKWLARVLGLRRPELPTRRQTVGQKRHTEEDRRTGREEGATGRMQCANGHDLDPCLGADSGGIWGWAQVRATVAAAEASWKHQAGRLVGLRRLRLRRLHELLRGGGGNRGRMSMTWRQHDLRGVGGEWPSSGPRYSG